MDVTWSGLRLAGIWASVPKQVESSRELETVFPAEDVARISGSTGVVERRVAGPHVCSSDLCFSAARELLDRAGGPADQVDALIFVSQTADHALPASACLLQDRLGLSRSCAAFDVPLGCSGYVYGLWLAGSLLSSRAARRVLLLAGDTISRIVGPRDRASRPLFGDAGTATLLEAVPEALGRWSFVLGTDGSGGKNLIVPAGRFREPSSPHSRTASEREGGNIRSDEDLYMDGAEVFAFTLKEVPALIDATLSLGGKNRDDIDAFVFHQANRFMLQSLGRKLRIPREKLILGLERFGNTSSASIPLAMTTELCERMASPASTLLLAGFGVGWSWAGAVIETGKVPVLGWSEV